MSIDFGLQFQKNAVYHSGEDTIAVGKAFQQGQEVGWSYNTHTQETDQTGVGWGLRASRSAPTSGPLLPRRL